MKNNEPIFLKDPINSRHRYRQELHNSQTLKVQKFGLIFAAIASFAAILSVAFSIFVYFDNKQLEIRVTILEQKEQKGSSVIESLPHK